MGKTKAEVQNGIFNILYDDIDINDATILQEQLNFARKSLYDLIQAYTKIQNSMLDLRKDLLERKNTLREKAGKGELTKLLDEDEQYNEITWQIEAYKVGMTITQEQIDMVKSDIRILTSSMYKKF
jgi:hypothetical protein